MSVRLIALIFGALAIGLIAGCGGGDDNSSTTIPKKEFTAQANAICAKHHNKIIAEFDAYVEKNGAPKANEREGALAAFKETVIIPSLEAEAEEFEALGLPKGGEEEVEDIWAGLDQGLEELEESGSKSTARPAGFEEANKISKELGLNEFCMVT